MMALSDAKPVHHRRRESMSDRTEQAKQAPDDLMNEGRDDCFMDIDRMVNEGLGGGNVTLQNGLIDDTTTDYMEPEQKSD
ncbi:hypothetical protein D3C78_890680 [compost metagenome]